MLPFIRDILEDLLRQDGLCVLAEGLGLPKLLAALVRLQAAQGGGLVLLLGCVEWQKRAVLREMAGEEEPADISAEMSVCERLARYAHGGCLFVTTRILVVDLLTQRLPASAVSGVLVCNAHRVTDTTGEAFAVRLLRGGGNSTAFVRAFSDRPGDLLRVFAGPEKVLKALLLRHLSLWPRFRDEVRADLDARPAELVELRIPLSDAVRLIQEAIVDVMDACLGELRRSSLVDVSELTVEDGMFLSFDRVLARQLEPVWHTAPRRLRQAVTDLRTLRGLAASLLRYDAVTFLRYLENLRASEGRDTQWLFADAAHTIFDQAKRRVYVLRKQQPAAEPEAKRRRMEGRVEDAAAAPCEAASAPAPPSVPAAVLEAVLEPLPKWGLLQLAVAEIQGEQAKLRAQAANADEGNTRAVLIAAADAPVLVMARDGAAARQLEAVLQRGPAAVMRDEWELYLQQRKRLQRLPHPAARGRGSRGGRAKLKGARAATAALLQVADALPGAGRTTRAEVEALLSAPSAAQQRGAGAARGRGRDAGAQEAAAQAAAAAAEECEDAVVDGIAVASLDAREGVLQRLQPAFIVMYEPDMAFSREVEVYKAERPGAIVRLYLLHHDTSFEEQRFHAAVRRETDSFKDLCIARQHMAPPLEQDGRTIAIAMTANASPGLVLPPVPGACAAAVSTRKAGGRAQAVVPAVVVVDMREFGAPLPCVLHSVGFALAPLTLEVGDYILSPELCVERKSVPDLVGSLAGGRLFHQAEAMCRHYTTPALLIEFDADKHFGLVSPGDLGEEVSSRALGSKLTLLLLHFPKLRVLWSRSVHATAALFASLKSNAAQPDAAAAAAVGADAGGEEAKEEPTNTAAMDFLRRLPGVTEGNAHALLRHLGSLAALAAADEPRLAQVLGDKGQAQRLHTFLHSPFPAFAT